MSVIGYAWWMGGLVLQSLVELWPITLLLLVATWIAIKRGGLPHDQQLRALPSVLFLFPVVIVLWGAAAHVEFGIRPAVHWRIAVLAVIALLHAAMAGAVIYISRGYRRQTALLTALISWFAIACIVQSTLALTGRLDPSVRDEAGYSEAEQTDDANGI